MGFDKLKNAYWLAHRVLGSRSRAFYGDVYDLPPELGEFDVGVIGQILVHLSDPVRALASVLARCREQLVITEGMIDDDKPTMTLASGGNESAWWRGSTGLYREVLATAGWQIERIERQRFRCVAAERMKPQLPTIRARLKYRTLRAFAPSAASMIKLTTIVARRA